MEIVGRFIPRVRQSPGQRLQRVRRVIPSSRTIACTLPRRFVALSDMARSSADYVTISRSYAIVSPRGTTGTYHQKVLAFTVAGSKAPARLFEGFLSSSRALPKLTARCALDS